MKTRGWFYGMIFLGVVNFWGCDYFFDFISPSIKITSPEPDQVVYGNVDITIEANDNKRLDIVKLFIDGKLIKTSKQGSFSYSWDLATTKADTEHTIFATAVDKNNNSNQSEIKIFGYGKNPRCPKLLNPTDGKGLLSLNPTFIWVEVPHAVRYHIQIDDSEDFLTPFISDNSLTQTDYTIPIHLKFNNTYFWRVRAKFDWSDWGQWTNSHKFSLTYITYNDECTWKYPTAGAVTAPVISVDGIVYFGSQDGNLYAIYPSGQMKWKFQTAEAVGIPAIDDLWSIFVCSSDGKLYALDHQGNLKWRYDGRFSKDSYIAIDNEGTIYIVATIYFGANSYIHFFIFNPNGTLKFEDRLGNGQAFAYPAIGPNGTIYINTLSSLYLFNKNGDRLEVNKSIKGSSSPAIDYDGTVYIGTNDGKFFALSPAGSVKWCYRLKTKNIFGSPVIGTQGTIFVTSFEKSTYAPVGKLHAIHTDGSVKWVSDIGRANNRAPAVGSDGTIYVTCDDKKMYIVNADGTFKEIIDTWDSECSSPTIGMNGILYTGSNNGHLYAMKSYSDCLADSPWPKWGKNNQNTSCAK